MKTNFQLKWGVFLPECTTPKIPIAVFAYADLARAFGNEHYRGRHEVKEVDAECLVAMTSAAVPVLEGDVDDGIVDDLLVLNDEMPVGMFPTIERNPVAVLVDAARAKLPTTAEMIASVGIPPELVTSKPSSYSTTLPSQAECTNGVDALDNLPAPLLNTSGRCDRGEHATCTRSSCECPCHVSRCSSCRKEVRSLCKGCSNDHRPRTSVAVCFVRNDSVLMVHHHERGWEFPVGKVEPEELLDVAAARELAEEAGVRVEPHLLRLVGIFQLRGRGFGHWINYMFAFDANVHAFESCEIIDNNLDEPPQWFTWTVLDLLKPGVISKTSHAIINNARLPRADRDPGYQTHCIGCLRQIPCFCMRGKATS